MKKFTLFLALITASVFYGQNTGSVVGKLTDKEYNNEPLAFANVLIKGTTKGTTSDFDGLYALENLDAGDYTLIYSFVGYETQELAVTVVAGKVTEVNVPMGASAASLDEVVITTTTKRESETALLLEQKKAIEFKQSIGAEEISKKGISDVASAVAKTTGISKQEGSGNIYVRGLGDRYNTTTMNGLPLPSNDPTRKNISLDIFSTDIVEYIDISKTYTYSNYGDFAGANIDIVSKNYTGKGFFEVKVGSGINSNAFSESNFRLQDGPNNTGFFSKNYPNNPLNAYNFDTSWDKSSSNKQPVNISLGLTGGDSFNVGETGKISFFASAAFDNGYHFSEGIARGSVNAQSVARRDLTFKSYAYNTNSTGLLNASYKINNDHSINFNTLYINSTTQDLDEYNGVIDIFDVAPNGGGFIRRSTFVRTQLFVNQLLGKHRLSDRTDLNWGTSYNIVNNSIPDRMQNSLIPVDNNNPNGPLTVKNLINAADNHRFYQDLEETEFAANLALSYKFNKNENEEYNGKLSIGYSGRFKNVNFEATQFNFQINNTIDQPTLSSDNFDGYFNQNNLNNDLFFIRTFRGNVSPELALVPQTYDGPQLIQAAYGAVEYKFSEKFHGIFSLRGEYIFQEINWDTAISPDGKGSLDRFEFLPSMSLKYALNDEQNLRFAASKTYTLPQFKERAPFLYDDVTTGTRGNPDLYPSTDYNVDLKWELFPKNDELLSITGFAKYIQNPINEIVIASASNDISWVNTGEKATAIGAEFEAKKNLFKFSSEDDDFEEKLSVGFNASYMHTNQDFDRNKVASENSLTVNFTNNEGKLSGASDLLLNGDLSYLKEYGKDKMLLATVSYSYFSDRIFAIATNGRGALVDKAVSTLDFVLKTNFNKHFGLSLKAGNLLNPTIERIQETQDITVLSFKKGINCGISLNYKF